MNAIICLALSCLLVGLLYVFMRQQLSAQDKKISDLTQLVVSVASQLQQQSGNFLSPASPPSLPAPLEVTRLPERVTVSDDSESEGETDSESESDNSEDEEEVRKVKQTIEPVEHAEVELQNTLDIVEDISIVLDLNDDSTKTINLFEDAPKPNYEKLTVKDLKELVSKQGGPGSLKTKKELIDYLEKKM